MLKQPERLRTERSQLPPRFYKPDGECIVGLREARKLSPLPLPSVSTVLSLLGSSGLTQYFRRQMFAATVKYCRQLADFQQWTDEDWAKEGHYQACEAISDEHGQQARDKGTELHDLIQSYNLARKHQKPIPQPPEHWAGQYRSYVGWYEENVADSLAVEEVLFGDGYAGRVDHICLLKDGRVATVDAKTQNLVSKKKFSHYLSWAMQLGAYAGADAYTTGGWSVNTLISLVFDPNGSAFESYEWPESPKYYAGLFMGLAEIWRAENNYRPEPADALCP